MIIKITYYPEAEDEMDADAQEPDKKFICHDVSEAEAAIGLLERKFVV